MSTGTVVEPEVLAPELKQTLEQELAPYRKHGQERTPITNDAEEMVALVYVAQRKRDYKEMEEIRDRLVRPYNTLVKQINAAFKTETEVCDQEWRQRDQDLIAYRTEKQARIDAANRKAIADAAELKRQEEAKAEEARQAVQRLKDEAERLEREENDRLLQVEMDRLAAEQKIRDEQEALVRAKQGGDARAAREAQETIDRAKLLEEERLRKAENDRLAAVAEQEKRDKAIIKQEAKADIAESKATMVTPTIQVNDSVGSRTLVDGSKVGTREVDDWYFSTGLPIHTDPQKKKYAEYYADDTRLPNGIPDRYWVLDLAKLGKDVKNGVPIDGCVKTTRNATTAGRK